MHVKEARHWMHVTPAVQKPRCLLNATVNMYVHASLPQKPSMIDHLESLHKATMAILSNGTSF